MCKSKNICILHQTSIKWYYVENHEEDQDNRFINICFRFVKSLRDSGLISYSYQEDNDVQHENSGNFYIKGNITGVIKCANI